MKSCKIFFFLTFLFFCACTNEKANKTTNTEIIEVLEDDPSDPASCQFSNQDGERALYNLLEIEDLSEAYFNKKYQKNWLDGILKASGRQTAVFVGQTNVQLFRAPHTSRGCNFFGFLKKAPSDLENQWRQLQRETRGAILGLYISVTDQLPSVQQKPALLVRSKTDRYTLIHEFMHHNFSQQRLKETGISDDEIKYRLTQTIEKMNRVEKNYLESQNMNAAVTYAELYELFSKDLDELMLRFTLEEITIESLLGEAFESGDLQHVTKYSYHNGGEYIRMSAQKYVELVEPFVNDLRLKRITSFMPHSQLLDGAEKNLQDIFFQRKSEAQNLAARSLRRRVHILGPRLAKNKEIECLHSKQIESFIKNIQVGLTY